LVELYKFVLFSAHYSIDGYETERIDFGLLGQKIRDGALWIVQNKTGARLGIELVGELASIVNRINARPRKAISPFLIQDENGQPLTKGALRSRFNKARKLAKVDFQFRDIRGKAATDTGNLAHSQNAAGAQESGYD
jgi:hypothetical protein